MNEIPLAARLAQGLLAVTIITPTGASRFTGALKTAWAALTTGSRTIPLGDNGALVRDLAAHIAASTHRA